MNKLISTILVLGLCLVAAHAEIRIQNVDRKIAVQGTIVRALEGYKVKNTGNAAVSTFSFCYLAQQYSRISLLQAKDGNKELVTKPTKEAGAPAGVHCFAATLAKPLPAGDTAELDVTTVYTLIQTAYPATVQQGETQLMLYVDNLYVVSPYTVSAQVTEVLLPSSDIKSFTQEKPVLNKDTRVTFGRYDRIEPFTLKEMKVHFANMKPFKQVTTLVKEITVSHWGNIYVDEHYELRHAGAKHSGSFSRLKYSYQYGVGASFKDVRAKLPATTHSIYYTDLIGNISSSTVRKTTRETVVDLETRYPLLGGWKVDFNLGYSLPLKGFLYVMSSGRRHLEIPFSTPLEDVHVDDLEVRVVLPEGSARIVSELPFDVDKSTETKYSYLDTTGRPVLVFKKKNVVPEHNVNLIVDYSFPATAMLREPAMLVAAFAAFFAFIIMYNRVEFVISKDEAWRAGKDKDKVAAFMQVITGHLQTIGDHIASIDATGDSLHSSGAVEGAQAARSAAEAGVKKSEDDVRAVVAELEAISAKQGAAIKDLLEKAAALQAKVARQFQDKVDMVKKGAAPADMNKKLAGPAKAIAEARAEYDGLVGDLFAAY